jgi:hypothetical protein
MNLNSIYITTFDIDGWPLCPRCFQVLHYHSQNKNGSKTIFVEDFSNVELARAVMKEPLRCNNCDWTSPTDIAPAERINLARCTVFTEIVWQPIHPLLPLVRFSEVAFINRGNSWRICMAVN